MNCGNKLCVHNLCRSYRINPLTELWLSPFLDQCPLKHSLWVPWTESPGWTVSLVCRSPGPAPGQVDQNRRKGWKTDQMRLPRGFSYKLKCKGRETETGRERDKERIREPERDIKKQNQKQGGKFHPCTMTWKVLYIKMQKLNLRASWKCYNEMRRLFRERNTHIIVNHLQGMRSTWYKAFQSILKPSKATPNPSRLIMLMKYLLGKFLVRFHCNLYIIFTAINEKASSSFMKSRNICGDSFFKYPWETLG